MQFHAPTLSLSDMSGGEPTQYILNMLIMLLGLEIGFDTYVRMHLSTYAHCFAFRIALHLSCIAMHCIHFFTLD